MQVDRITNILGWEQNRRVSEVRTTYHYDKSPTVTVVSKIREDFKVYTSGGQAVQSTQPGSTVDITI